MSIETRLEHLEDAAALRESFIARYEDPATKAVVDQVRVRIDSMQQVDDDHVDVVYSILLDQAEVLGHLPGGAVREGGRWLVSRRLVLPGRDPRAEHRPRGLPVATRVLLTCTNSTLVGRPTQE